MKIPVLLHVMVLILKGIGFDLQDGSDYAGQFGLMTGGRVHEDDIKHIAHYKENPLDTEGRFLILRKNWRPELRLENRQQKRNMFSRIKHIQNHRRERRR